MNRPRTEMEAFLFSSGEPKVDDLNTSSCLS